MALKSIEEYEKELAEVMDRLGRTKKVVAAQRGDMFTSTKEKFIADMEHEVFRLRSLLNVMRKDKALKDQAEAIRNAEAKGEVKGQPSGFETREKAVPGQMIIMSSDFREAAAKNTLVSSPVVGTPANPAPDKPKKSEVM